jgi:hypothetical protein
VSDTVVGGAFGLAVANALFNNNVSSKLLDILTPEETARVTGSAIAFLGSADEATRAIVVDAYAHGLRSCYILFTAGSGCCIILALFIKEVKFRKDPPGLVRAGTNPPSPASEQRGMQTLTEEKV